MSLYDSLNGFQNIMSSLSVIIAAVGLILGILECFFGYKFLKFWVSFFGFVIGGAIGYGLSSYWLDSKTVIIVITLVVALILGVAAFMLYKVGVFIFVGLLASIICYIVLSKTSLASVWLFVICLAAFIAFGLLGVKLQKPIVIVITAVAGASAAAQALVSLVPSFGAKSYYSYIIIALLSITGIIVQLSLNKEDNSKKSKRSRQKR